MPPFNTITTNPQGFIQLKTTLIPTNPMYKVCGVFGNGVEPSFATPKITMLVYIALGLLDSPDQQLTSFSKFKKF